MSEQITHEDYEITLATLHNLVARAVASAAGTEHARGYRWAMLAVKAVLDKHGAPPGEPVHFGEQE